MEWEGPGTKLDIPNSLRTPLVYFSQEVDCGLNVYGSVESQLYREANYKLLFSPT